DRLFTTAADDEGAADPAVRAVNAYYRGSANYLTYRDDGETWTHAIDEHRRWLALPTYPDAGALFAIDALAGGRTREAARWSDLGRRRLTGSSGEATSRRGVPAMVPPAPRR